MNRKLTALFHTHSNARNRKGNGRSLLAGLAVWIVIGANGPATVEASPTLPVEHRPLLCRPYRPGHWYGNTVRRRHRRGAPHHLFNPSTQRFQIRYPYVEQWLDRR